MKLSKMQRRVRNAIKAKKMIYGGNVPSRPERDRLFITGLFRHRPWKQRIKSLGLTLATYYSVKRKSCGIIPAVRETAALAWLMVRP